MTTSKARLSEARLAAASGDLVRLNAMLDGLPYAAKMGAAALTSAIAHGQWAVAEALVDWVNITPFRHGAVEQAILAHRPDLFARMLPRVSVMSSHRLLWQLALPHAEDSFFAGLLTRLPTEWKSGHRPWFAQLMAEALTLAPPSRVIRLALAVPVALHETALLDPWWAAHATPAQAGQLIRHAGDTAALAYPQTQGLARLGDLQNRPAAPGRSRRRT